MKLKDLKPGMLIRFKKGGNTWGLVESPEKCIDAWLSKETQYIGSDAWGQDDVRTIYLDELLGRKAEEERSYFFLVLKVKDPSKRKKALAIQILLGEKTYWLTAIEDYSQKLLSYLEEVKS